MVVVQYIRDHEVLGIFARSITQKPASHFHHGSTDKAYLKYLQTDPKPLNLPLCPISLC